MNAQPSIELHIEELVLHGFAPGDRHRIAEALQGELMHLLADPTMRGSLATPRETARLDGGSFQVAAQFQARSDWCSSGTISPARHEAMNAQLQMQPQSRAHQEPAFAPTPMRSHLLQRKCACGGTPGLTGECEECKKKKRLDLQTKLQMNDPGDSYEQEADRVADQVMATTAHHDVSATPVIIQRFAGQSKGQMDEAPASVDHALASPGRPLEPALRQDMGQRFDHDFAGVRVHADAAAEQSARDVNAHAYTVGHDIVFGAGRFAPGTHDGRRLIAHELTHVVQQSSGHSSARLQRAPRDSSSTVFVQIGETDLRQVARRLSVDPDELLLANPEISDPSRLKPGQVIYRPVNQSFATEPISKPGPKPPSVPKPAPLSADEEAFEKSYGKTLLHAYQQEKQELAKAYEIYRKTGKVPATTRFAPIEVKRGKLMSRSARYDAMAAALGKGLPSAKQATIQIDDVTYDNRDQDYLTKEELYDEFWMRHKKESNACEDEHWWPKYIHKCQRAVDEKYGGQSFIAWRDANERAAYYEYQRYQEKVEAVTSGGPGSLAGRVIGQAIGGEKGAEYGAGIGGFFDAALPVYAGSKGAKTEDYQGSAGWLVRRDTPITEVAPPPEATHETPDETAEASSGKAAASESEVPKGSEPSASGTGEADVDMRGIRNEDGTITIREAEPGESVAGGARPDPRRPSVEAVAQAEQTVTETVAQKYGHLGVRDISDPTKHPYATGVDRFFIIGKGDGLVLLEVDAKLSVQDAPAIISEVSAFETAARTGGRSRMELLDRALQENPPLVTQTEYEQLREAIEQGRVIEEVHGFGSVSGVSADLADVRTGQVGYVQGDQFAHAQEQLEERAERNLTTKISATLVTPKGTRATTKKMMNDLWKEFQEAFGQTPEKPPRTPRKKK